MRLSLGNCTLSHLTKTRLGSDMRIIDQLLPTQWRVMIVIMLILPLWEFLLGTWYTASVPDLHDGSIDSFAFGVKNLKIWPFLFFCHFRVILDTYQRARNSPGLSVWLPCSDLWVLCLGLVCSFSGQTAVHNFFDGTKFTHQPQKKAPPCRLWCILHNWTDHTLTVCSWAAVDLMQ